MGKKYDNLLRKNADLREKRWKNGEKEDIFTVKNIIFGKRGGGKNIIILANIHPCRHIGGDVKNVCFFFNKENFSLSNTACMMGWLLEGSNEKVFEVIDNDMQIADLNIVTFNPNLTSIFFKQSILPAGGPIGPLIITFCRESFSDFQKKPNYS